MITELQTPPRMRYLRVCLGNEAGDPGMTIYEIDASGWVHRQVQLCPAGSRFAPEDILMCSPIHPDAMIRHPAAEEIDETEFDLLWSELEGERSFHNRLPDPCDVWHGFVEHGLNTFELQWIPDCDAPAGWIEVPGFTRLFVRGDARTARSACAAIFVDPPIHWAAMPIAA
jgi:hypothetical protein